MMGHFFMIFCREKSAFFEIPGFIISRFRLATQNLEDEPYTKSYFQFSSIIRGHLIIFNSSLLFCYNNNNNIISLFLRNRVSTDSNPISSFLESLDPATICVYPNLPHPAPCFRMSENKEGVNIFLKSIYRYILELGRPDGRFIYPPISDVSIRGYPHNNPPPPCLRSGRKQGRVYCDSRPASGRFAAGCPLTRGGAYGGRCGFIAWISSDSSWSFVSYKIINFLR